jgi:hypothetical protein
MNVEKMVTDFERLAEQVFATEDFGQKNKIERKIEKLVDKVYAQGVEKIFYDELFVCPHLLARIEIAIVSDDRNYDLYRSLEVLEKAKKDARNSVFFDDLSKNKKWQDYFAQTTNAGLKEKIAFLEEIGDKDLFQNYYDCMFLYGRYYQDYLSSKKVAMEAAKGRLVLLFQDIRNAEKLDRFFALLFRKAEEDKSLLNVILTHYFSWLVKYRSDEEIDALNDILQKRAKELNPKMRTFLKERIDEMGT